MENASKALIIAGAIIVAIVLITLGYNVIKNNTDLINTKGNTDQAEVEAFNAEFESYAGQNKKAADVRNLCSKVFAKNGTERKNQTNRIINLTYNGSSITTIPNDLNNGQNYTITIAYDQDTGYINAITIN